MCPRERIHSREIELERLEFPTEFFYDEEKWGKFNQALRVGADELLVAFPEVLGDTYAELLINLSKIAKSGKALRIAGGARIFERKKEAIT